MAAAGSSTTAADRVDWGRLVQLGQLDPQEPSAALPQVLGALGRCSEEIVVIEQRSDTGPTYLPPMARYSVVTRLDGAAKVMAWGGRTAEHRDGRHETFVVPPFQPSFFYSRAPAHSVAVTLAPSLFSRLMQGGPKQGVLAEGVFSSFSAPDGVLCGLALAALTHLRNGTSRSSGVLRCIGEAVALHLMEQHRPAPVAAATQGLTAWQLSRLEDYVHAHLDQPLPVSALAGLLGQSATQFSRAFKQARGQTPARWMQHLRMERAHALIVATRRPITDIALELGYDDLPHFSRLFSRHWGQAPSTLRRPTRAN